MSAPKLRNCTRCRGAFMASPGQRVCPTCIRQEEEVFVSVRDYLRENRGAPMKQVVDDVGVSPQALMHLLRSGRLDADLVPEDAALECSVCGKTITSGKLCSDCEKKTTSKLEGARPGASDGSGPADRGPGYREVDGNDGGSPKTKSRGGYMTHKRGKT